MKKICIYGKGGIGKSTTACNLAAALAEMGKQVAVVGCDPKADSTRCIMGYRIPTVLENLKNGGNPNAAFRGYRDILCFESGGPEPGTGCAGRGIAAALQEIKSRNLLEGVDVVLYDVLGDVVCGGFSMPMRDEVADEVYLVTTSDFMSIYAANNICRGVRKYAQTGEVRLSGIIYNERSGRADSAVIERFAEKVGTKIVGKIPMSPEISEAEYERKTALEYAPQCEASLCFKKIAEAVINNEGRCIPAPLSDEEVEDICRIP